MRYKIFIVVAVFIFSTAFKGVIESPRESDKQLQLALLKYNAGDWYSNPTALKNLALFCNQELGTNFDYQYATVEVGSADLFNYSFLHMTGHGNVLLSDSEAENLRMYLMAGGFLHVDDNYGMDPMCE